MNDPLKTYRHRLRRWRNTRHLARERRRYLELFVKRGLTLPSEEEIRELCRQRLPGMRARVMGQLRVLALFHHYNWESDALLPPLSSFGPVRHYDWADDGFDQQAKGWHKGPKQAMNKALLDRVRRWVREDGVDVIFCYLSGETVSPETVREMADLGVPMVNLALNDKEAFVGPVRGGQVVGARDICRHFHLCWTSTEDALEKYCVEGALPLYLPEGADPSVHRPHDVDRDIDVSFVGQCYGNRPEVIDRLRAEGIAVEAFGYGWPNGPLATDEMVRMYSRSRINLGFGGVDGLDATYCLKGRDFEIPMSGGLYLTEHHPELARCFRPGDEIVTYRNFSELLATIRDLLDHPAKADAIRQRGYQRAMTEHTWQRRFDKVFRLLGVLGD